MYIVETPTSPGGNQTKIATFQNILEEKIFFDIVNRITKSGKII